MVYDCSTHIIQIYSWLVVWNMNFMIFHILGKYGKEFSILVDDWRRFLISVVGYISIFMVKHCFFWRLHISGIIVSPSP